MLLWFSSGLLMSVLPIESVHGDHLIDRSVQPLAVDPARQWAPLDALLRSAGGPVKEVRYRLLLGRNVVEIERQDGLQQLYDGRSGKLLSPLAASSARAIGLDAYRGNAGGSARASLITKATTEYRGPLPAWRLSYADDEATRFYVAANTGRITAVRNGTWRLYDFFWGLHIMDWKDHEDFNTPWLIVFAAGGLLLTLAGTALLYFRWPRRRRRRLPG